MKKIFMFLTVFGVLFAAIIYLLYDATPDIIVLKEKEKGNEPTQTQEVRERADASPTTTTATASSSTSETSQPEAAQRIGESILGRPIEAYTFGTGETKLLFVGGIHGGYAWNTVLVAYDLIDYLKNNPERIPKNVTVAVVPVLNPDGLYDVTKKEGRITLADVPKVKNTTGAGRFNARGVDLNRNFDCDWQPEGVWRDKAVSGGTSPFSEPESQALRDFVNRYRPDAAIVWYSAAGGVYASNCHNGVLPETTKLTQLYADASGYSANTSFDFYEITGDATNWLAKNGIPAISVLLSSHDTVEWEQNRSGVEAILKHYAAQ